MTEGITLREAKRLHNFGFAVHLLHEKSKRPIESAWTTGPRKLWPAIEASYQDGLNIGVRLGEPSKIGDKYLAVIDVDVKSSDPKHKQEAADKVAEILGGAELPEVLSGRGNDSRHYYLLTEKPATPRSIYKSKEIVKVFMPSAAPSKKELAQLSPKEIEEGLRLRAAWEVSLMGQGQQVVLPPSIHCDSGKPYKWRTPFDPANAFVNLDFVVPEETPAAKITSQAGFMFADQPVQKPTSETKPGPKALLKDFVIEDVELSWLPIPANIKAMIETGEGVEDRSASLMTAALVMVKAGLTQNEILSVLTDPNTYLGKTGYDHAKTKDRLKAAAWVYKHTLVKAQGLASAEALFATPLVEGKERSAKEVAADQAVFEDTFDWRLDLTTNKDGYTLATLKNVLMILENEVGPDFIKRDLFSHRDFYEYKTPWGGKAKELIADEHAVNAKLWFSQNFDFEPRNVLIEEAHIVLAGRNAFDPLLDFLEGLPPWDGVVRLDTWLAKNFEAEAPTESAKEYLAQVFRKWLVAMVGRIYEPGLKFDWLPIFEGTQGIGKSSLGRLLCGDEYFRDSLPDLHDKDASLALQGVWVVEFGELATIYKSALETVKGFLTRTVDKVRPPFGRRTVETPRRCVFFGTTNHETYLRDETGNRRFKPVKVGKLNFEAIKKDREQLFAEAVYYYKTGIQKVHGGGLELSGGALEYEAQMHDEKTVEDDSNTIRQELLNFMQEQEKLPFDLQFDFDKFRMADLFKKREQKNTGVRSFQTYPLGGLEMFLNSRTAQFCAKALKSLGFQKFKSSGIIYWRKAKRGVG